MRSRRRAVSPTPEQLQEREERKAEERLKSQAVPAQRPSGVEHKCAGQLYKVSVDRVVHGKRKGENVTLCPHKGATQALVSSGHLVPTQSATARAVTTSSSATVKADDKKGADHG